MGPYAATDLGCDTGAIGYTDCPPGKNSLAAFQHGFEQAGGTVIEAIPMGGPREVPDFTPFFQRVKAAAPLRTWPSIRPQLRRRQHPSVVGHRRMQRVKLVFQKDFPI